MYMRKYWEAVLLFIAPLLICFLQYFYLQGYGRGSVKIEEEDRHMNVNVSSSGQGTKTVILQIPKVDIVKVLLV